MSKFDEIKSIIMKVIKTTPENIYIYDIDENADSTGQDTLVLLTEASSNPDSYADDTFNKYKQAIKITIFYSLQYPRKFEADEISLQKELMAQGWHISESQSHYQDPTTQQQIKNITIERLQDLDKI